MLLSDLSAAEIRNLVEKTQTPTGPRTVERRSEFAARYLAMRERPDQLVRERIVQTFQDPQVAAQVQRFATGIYNPIRDLSGRVAKAYSNAPIRRLDGRGDDENRDFLRALDTLHFNAHMRMMNRWQVAMNTIAVLTRPCMYRGEPSVDFMKVTGAASEVILDPDAPFAAEPAILSYCLFPDPNDRMLAYNQDAGTELVCVVDAEAFRYFDRSNHLRREVFHDLGRFPGAVLRATIPEHGDGNDWWDPDMGRSVTQALREAGMAGAIMAWARKSMFGKLITVERDPQQDAQREPEQDTGQHLGHPEAPVEVADGTVKVQDMEVKVEQFRQHMGMVLAQAARESTGNASLLDDPANGASPSDVAEVAKHATLRQLQREQTEYLGPFERDLLEVMAGLGLPGLPSPEVLRESFDINYVPLTFLDTPEARLKYHQEATRFGTGSPVDLLMEQGHSEAEAVERLRVNVERQADLNDLRASRRSTSDPAPGEGQPEELDPAAPGESPAALTGRFGGRASPALARATE